MGERLQPKHETPRGILRGPARPEAQASPVSLRRWHAPDDLAPFVEHCWCVSWNLVGRPPVEQGVLSHPSAHWTVEGGRSEVFFVSRGRFSRTLAERGRVVSVKFRPGGLCAWVFSPMHTHTDQISPAARFLGEAAGRLATTLPEEDEAAALALCQVLREASPRRDPDAILAGEIVEEIAQTPAWMRVQQVSAHTGLSPLALQRLFRQKIGLHPKWILQRYRMHEAIEALHAAPQSQAGAFASLAGLAAELGFTDQAHFSRSFKAFVGLSPKAYVQGLTTRP